MLSKGWTYNHVLSAVYDTLLPYQEKIFHSCINRTQFFIQRKMGLFYLIGNTDSCFENKHPSKAFANIDRRNTKTVGMDACAVKIVKILLLLWHSNVENYPKFILFISRPEQIFIILIDSIRLCGGDASRWMTTMWTMSLSWHPLITIVSRQCLNWPSEGRRDVRLLWQIRTYLNPRMNRLHPDDSVEIFHVT